ncbi:MAG: homoserine dehydrogenase [Acidimicrobiia bacterium]|nr:homoserine dehydrogenase [Acidimicrobiia bacterium]
MRRINIGLIGAGVVGSALVSQLDLKYDRIKMEFDIDIRVNKILVRDLSTKRDIPSKSILYSDDDTQKTSEGIFTTSLNDIVESKEIDLVVEVAGGIDSAYKIISSALKKSLPVVTANKALLAEKGGQLYSLANENSVDLLFEAAVAGGVPVVRPLRESLAVEHINSVRGILNGTTNFILTQMTKNGTSYNDALKEAQQLGYAEADPTADVQGHDAAAKIAIISLIATGTMASQNDVKTIGISNVSSSDIAQAKELGYVIKLIATIEEKNEKEIFLRVEPTFVPNSHPFSTTNDGFNAVFVVGKHLGEIMFYGRGAGGDPTASAVLGDVIDASINISRKRKGSVVGVTFEKSVANPDEWKSKFFMSATVKDEPGVLAQIAQVYGNNNISLETVQQDGKGVFAEMIFITHSATSGDIEKAIKALLELSCVENIGQIYPLMD